MYICIHIYSYMYIWNTAAEGSATRGRRAQCAAACSSAIPCVPVPSAAKAHALRVAEDQHRVQTGFLVLGDIVYTSRFVRVILAQGPC